MSRTNRWFPLDVDRFFAKTRRFSPAARGAYICLLCEQWQRGTLPADPGELAGMAGMRPDQWAKVSERVLELFVVLPEGTIADPDLLAERTRTSAIAQKRSGAARDRWANLPSAAPGARAPSQGVKPLKTNEAGDAHASVLHGVCRTQYTVDNTVTLTGNCAAGGASQKTEPVAQVAEAATETVPPAQVVVFKDEAERVRSQLWTEGREIMARIAPSMSRTDVGNLVGMLAKANGGGTRGGTRAIQTLRDVEQRVASGSIPGYAAAGSPEAAAKVLQRYIMGIVKAGGQQQAATPVGEDGEPMPGTDAWAKQQRAKRAAAVAARSGTGATMPPAAGPEIDGSAERVG